MFIRLFLSALCVTCATTLAADRKPVVVELFTSEGCSSCPPADADFARQIANPPDGVEIIPLAWHIDYWDNLGWRDPFDSQIATGRQYQYVQSLGLSSAYTPQLVIDGRAELVGGDNKATIVAINDAKSNSKQDLSLRLSHADDPNAMKLELTVPQVAGLAADDSAELLIAVTEDDLKSQPNHGENAHRKLQHTAVVRSSQFIQDVKPGTTTATLALATTWNCDNLHIIAILQSKKTRKILAATMITIPSHDAPSESHVAK